MTIITSVTWEQTYTPLLPCHPDRLTIKSRRNTSFVRMPRGCSSDQPRVTVGLSGWSAFSGVFMCLRVTIFIWGFSSNFTNYNFRNKNSVRCSSLNKETTYLARGVKFKVYVELQVFFLNVQLVKL